MPAPARWTAAEDEWLRVVYPDAPSKHIASYLGRSYSAIKNRAVTLGLNKSTDYMATQPGCFKPGQVSWNKGLSYMPGGRVKESQFKPGHRPSNYMPLGSHRVTKDGILQRKVAETGYPPTDWRSEHVVRWEEYHGRPVPRGYIVRFRDSDQRNFEKGNLELVSKAEHAMLNKFFALESPPEGGFDVLLTLARIKLAEGRRKREATQ